MTDIVEVQGVTENTPDNPLGHAGELEMRQHFPGPYHWDKHSLGATMSPVIKIGLVRFAALHLRPARAMRA